MDDVLERAEAWDKGINCGRTSTRALILALDAELRALRADVVWAIQHEAEISFVEDGSWMVASYSEPSFPLSCTDADILRAVREAREGGRDHE